MTSLYTGLVVIVAAMTVAGTIWRFARSVFRVALAGRQLATAVRDNTAATDALAGEIRTYRTQTDHRLDILEALQHGPRPHP